MLKNLPKTAHHQVICEANFLRLKKLMGFYAEKEYCFEVLDAENIPQKISFLVLDRTCLLYTSPSPRDRSLSRMPSSA